MNTFLNEMKNEMNYGYTENGGIKHLSTLDSVLDMFAMGGAYRNRSEGDCILLFKNAFEQDSVLALKCLFYLRDVRGGQGERRFFRTCMRWLAENYPDRAAALIQYIPEYGRYDDWFCLFDTFVEKEVFEQIRSQLIEDMRTESNGISLCAKWLPSENTSSAETVAKAKKIRHYLGISARDYRKMLTRLRKKINVLEMLMSANRWDEIEFDKIPSKAGIVYKNAFARRDIISKKYETFIKSKDTKVNAKTLYPYEIAERAFKTYEPVGGINRLALQKYWDALPDYYQGRKENGLAVVDVSGSMWGRPLAAAVSLGAYVADKAHGPFANHFITFSRDPELVRFEGVDIVDKFKRAENANWGMNTNIVKVFELLLQTALKDHVRKEDMPTRLYIFSDMEFDRCVTTNNRSIKSMDQMNTVFDTIAIEWAKLGYTLPDVIFWNLDARHNNIPAIGRGFSYVSGFSPTMIDTILSGKDGVSLMLEKLNSERYAVIK